MARNLFDSELGYGISALNGARLVALLAGAAAPGGDAGVQDAAPIGSLYQRTDGEIFRKTANAGATGDWVQMDQAANPNNYAQAAGVTTSTIVDSVLVDTVLATEWEVHVREDANPENVKSIKIWATHDGTASADAASIDDTAYGKLRIGSNFNVDLDVILNGTGGTQTMQLQATSSTAGVTVTTRRNDVSAP